MHLRLKDVGQIHDADIRFGDLTVFVGAQATGKSIALQFLKLVVDLGSVQAAMTRYGLDWGGRLPDFFDAYFGEGMRGLWRNGESEVWWQGKPFELPKKIARMQRSKVESLFYIPAQRVLTLREGWPRPFSDYSPGDPFAVRQFSQKLNGLLAQDFRADESLFPQVGRLKGEFRSLLERSVFAKFGLKIDKFHSQKRLVLGAGDQDLPLMVWSAGQREFVPLLLGLYWLMPSAATPRRGKLKWVVLEELEMGLHPRAISVLLLMVLELLVRGYRVCLSTHSPQVLETVWALRHLKANGASPAELLEMFEVHKTPAMKQFAETIMTKDAKVYYFDTTTGRTKEISRLDPESEEAGEGGWGGLTEFSGRANTAVARSVANAERGDARVTFQEAIDQTPELRQAWQSGLGALRRSDRPHVDAKDPRLLAGSVDIDGTLKEKYPNENRWDYAIGHRPANLADEIVYWVEVHPASAGEVKVVRAKLQWLKQWLRDRATKLHSMRKEFIWVSSGKTAFTLNSPQQKQLALLGLQHKGRVFRIPARVVA